MERPRLTLACGSYDRIDPLRDGTVRPQGIDLEVVTVDDPRELFDRVVAGDAFDLAEMSSAEYITMTSTGTSAFVALPVFTSRVFRHSFICCNTAAGIHTPKDLEGRRIGVPLYTMSAAIWCRALLRDDYGVDLSTITWVEGAIDKPGSHGTPKTSSLAKPTKIEANRSAYSLSELLERGEIDAVLGALMPTNFGVASNIVRLFPNYRAVEKDYYLRTGIHPIMHLIVIRKRVFEAHPWIAGPLRAAFEEAKQRALQRLYYTGAPKTMLPFLHAEVEETMAIFGRDPWPDGLEANRRALEKAISSMLEDGVITRPVALEELFA